MKLSPVSVLSFLLFACAILQTYHFTLKQPGYDFYNFWIYAQEFKHSRAPNFYSIEFDKLVAKKNLQKALQEENDSKFRRAALWSEKIYERGHVSAATPFFYACFSTLSSKNYDKDLTRFQLVSIFLFCLIIYAIGRASGNGSSTALLIISFLLLFWTPFHNDTVVANLARIQTALLGGCVLIWAYFNHRPGFMLGGILLGISLLLKPNTIGVPVSLAFVWFFRTRSDKLVFVIFGAISGALIGLVYSTIYFGGHVCWLNWLHALLDLQGNPLPVGNYNLSLAHLLDNYLQIDNSIAIFFALISSLVLSLWAARKNRVQICAGSSSNVLISDLLGMGTGLLMIFMSFKVVWDHYFLLLAPVLVALIGPVHIGNETSQHPIDASVKLLGGLFFFIYALLPLRLLIPAAPAQGIALTIGVGSIIFWGLLLFRLYREVKGSIYQSLVMPTTSRY